MSTQPASDRALPGALFRPGVNAGASREIMVIARRDSPDAVVMSLDTFNRLMETVHLLKTPANAAHLARSIEQYRQGKLIQQGLVDA